jgi:hypothetical protein
MIARKASATARMSQGLEPQFVGDSLLSGLKPRPISEARASAKAQASATTRAKAREEADSQRE